MSGDLHCQKDRRTVVAALSDMVRISGSDYASNSRHEVRLGQSAEGMQVEMWGSVPLFLQADPLALQKSVAIKSAF